MVKIILFFLFDLLASEFGLFANDVQHPSRSYWLDPSRALSFYALKTGV